MTVEIQNEPSVMVEEQPEPEVVASPIGRYRAITIWGYEDDLMEFEDRIESFLNSSPKEIVSIAFSSLGIKHYCFIVYREGAGEMTNA